MKTETLEISTVNGDTSAHVVLPENGNGRAIVVIHEWWGLNDHIMDIAGRYAEEGFTAVAPDLYRGRVATDPETASEMMHGLAIEDGLDTIEQTFSAVRKRYDISRFGITGYCMGGTFALRAACEIEGFAAAVPFYGDIPEEAVLKKLKVPTVFVSGTRDGWITPEKVHELENAAEKYELPVSSLKYDADHAFFNNTRPDVFDESSAKDAWAQAVAFFREKL
jgi:carboxymethylenebutenolidase